MATLTFPSFCFNPSSAGLIPKLTSTTSFSPPLSCSILSGYNGISLHPSFISSRTNAKFDKFQGDVVDDDDDVITPSTSNSVLVADTVKLENQVDEEDIEEDDSCLPSNLEGAVRQSGEAAALFVTSGGMRGIVELLIPQLTFLDDEGAQAELWQLSRVFLETIMKETGYERVKAIYPDAGAAALLKYQWTDAAFEFASLSDRKPVAREDELVVMIVPDFQMLEYVERIAADLSDDPPRPLIMWNPRLISAEVGVGFNVRNLKRFFLRTFTTVYSMKPLPSGAVFRCYPGSWKVFYDDKDRPNRYLLAKELMGRPDAEDLEIIFGDVEEKSESGGPSLFSKAAGIFSSINRFMKAM